MGRTSKFTPEFKKKALILFRKGYSDREAFTELGISKNTFYRYLNENSDFSDQIQQVREKNVPHVENCMLKKCEGYFIEEEEILGRYEETKEPILDKDGKPTGEFKIIKGMKPYTVKKTKKYIPPSDQMIKLFLETHNPETYNIKQKVEHSGKLEVDTKNLTLTKDELDELWRDVRKEKIPIDEPKTSE